jgi:hypothetical protein
MMSKCWYVRLHGPPKMVYHINFKPLGSIPEGPQLGGGGHNRDFMNSWLLYLTLLYSLNSSLCTKIFMSTYVFMHNIQYTSTCMHTRMYITVVACPCVIICNIRLYIRVVSYVT